MVRLHVLTQLLRHVDRNQYVSVIIQIGLHALLGFSQAPGTIIDPHLNAHNCDNALGDVCNVPETATQEALQSLEPLDLYT